MNGSVLKSVDLYVIAPVGNLFIGKGLPVFRLTLQ